MAIELAPDDQKTALASLRRFVDQEFEVELSDIQLRLLLQYFLKELAPTIRNQALEDAQVFLRERLADMDATLHEPEFVYWPKATIRRK